MKPSCGSDFKVGSTTDRRYFRDEIAFDDVCQHHLLLAICRQLIGHSVKLRSILGRTLRAGSPAQPLHADVAPDSADAPVVAFILMLDAFTPANGATRFIPGSQSWPDPSSLLQDPRLDCEGEVLTCGAAGSMIVFNASVWHGHAANTTPRARRSIQGYFGRF
jgi:ectoine hydroxylase-related dioxygenase (phytanoyl-CoA dioxygenase family)